MSVAIERELLQRSIEPKPKPPKKIKPPTRDQFPVMSHEPDSLFPRMDRARRFTDEEFEAELLKIAKQLQAQGRPLIDTTWRMKTWSGRDGKEIGQ